MTGQHLSGAIKQALAMIHHDHVSSYAEANQMADSQSLVEWLTVHRFAGRSRLKSEASSAHATMQMAG